MQLSAAAALGLENTASQHREQQKQPAAYMTDIAERLAAAGSAAMLC